MQKCPKMDVSVKTNRMGQCHRSEQSELRAHDPSKIVTNLSRDPYIHIAHRDLLIDPLSAVICCRCHGTLNLTQSNPIQSNPRVRNVPNGRQVITHCDG